MITYKMSYPDGRMKLTQTYDEPEIVVTTDLEEVGIIPAKADNYGMIEAIEAVDIITDCVILSVRRK